MYIGIRHKHLNDKHYDDVDNKCNAHKEEPPSRAIVGNHSQNETNHSHRLEEVEFTVIVHAGNNIILIPMQASPVACSTYEKQAFIAFYTASLGRPGYTRLYTIFLDIHMHDNIIHMTMSSILLHS